MTDEELRAMLDAATPGPWKFYTISGEDPNGDEIDTDVEVISSSRYIHGHDLGYRDDTDTATIANARLIAAAPDLAAEVLRLRAENARLVGEVEGQKASAATFAAQLNAVSATVSDMKAENARIRSALVAALGAIRDNGRFRGREGISLTGQAALGDAP